MSHHSVIILVVTLTCMCVCVCALLLLFFCTVPCQNVLDYFKTVLEFHNQLVQPLPEEQLTEVRKQVLSHRLHSSLQCWLSKAYQSVKISD